MNLRYRTQNGNEEKTDADANGPMPMLESVCIFCGKNSEEESFFHF